ncbi:MalY/PatB family protein [Xylanibacter oryzae]|uniref:MalY/PatB family protein n=1 Tax=Xylanibacter oryzae TaxID=185293 RepID=UPI0004ADC3CD|nr:PatB family C-S lyase [Xylanibacter oryzae]
MIKYNFDKIVDRSGTGALKLDVLKKRYGRSDLLPLWVADMDFETPEFIVDAISKRLEHHIFGYTVEPEDYWPTVIDWIESHHQWNINEDWITYIPGIVKGIGMAVNVFTQKDEKVIIQPPVYHPFRLTPIGNGREVVFNPLKRNEDGTYEMDFDNLTEVADDKCRMLILSNPHNPGGIVWSKETLVRLADFCYDHNILVLSDEIHCDMAIYGNKHIPFASVSDKAAHCSITFGAPTKTFNLAGIVSSYAIIPDDKIRAQYFGWLRANELNEPTLFAPIATIAAFRYGEEWRKQMLEYVEGNIDYVIEYCAKNIPQIKPLRPQASFLLWLDCRDLNLNHEQLNDLFINKANLALNDGEMFGKGGEGYMRLNVGCPRALLNEAMDRLKTAIAK